MQLDLDFIDPSSVFSQLLQIHVLRNLRRELHPRTSATLELAGSRQTS